MCFGLVSPLSSSLLPPFIFSILIEAARYAGKMKARGVGATLDAAWDNVTGLSFRLMANPLR
jgi:hypothetical protein